MGMNTGYKVADIMTTNPVKIDAEASVQECAQVMSNHGIGSLIVLKNGKFAGLVTEEDLVAKIVLKDLVASKVKVHKIMTPLKDIISITPDKDIQEAVIVMKENEIRRLPVMRHKVLYGLITSKDILRIQPDLFDLIVDSYDLRESDRKLRFLDQD
jgi:CBS domain-containing protein